MAIQSSNSEWLSTSLRKPDIKHNSKKKINKPVRQRSPLREISFIQLSQSSKRNAPLHQTRVSTFFKKKVRKKKVPILNDELITVYDSSSKSKINELLDDCTFSCTNEQTSEVTFNEDLLPKHIPYDEEALFGICGDSLNETSDEVVDLEDSFVENLQVKNQINPNFNLFKKTHESTSKNQDDCLNDDKSSEVEIDLQLSPCVLSKYKERTSRTSKKEIVKEKSFFQPIGSTNFSNDAKTRNCVRKLSLSKQKKDNLYETKLVPECEENNSADDFSQSCVSSLAFTNLNADEINTFQSESMRKCIGDILNDSDAAEEETADDSYRGSIGSQETFGTFFSSSVLTDTDSS